MKNRLIIGLEGAVINNGNMGCVALTCSILNMLEKISKELSTPITYFVFEGEVNSEKNKNICKLLQIQEEQICSVPTRHLYRIRSMIRHPIKTKNDDTQNEKM